MIQGRKLRPDNNYEDTEEGAGVFMRLADQERERERGGRRVIKEQERGVGKKVMKKARSRR